MILNDKTTSGNIIGRVLLIEESGIYVYNQRTERIEINLDEYDPVFLYEMLNAPNIREKIIKQAQGNTQIYVNWIAISLLEYMIPSKEEQVKIGEYLHSISNLITLHHRKYMKNIDLSLFAWEQRKLSDVVNIGSGMDYKHLGEGNIPVYGTGGYMCSVDKALSNDKDAIGIGRKGTIDKPYLLRAPFWTVDTLFYCIPKEDYDLDFTSCLFQNVDWKKKDESTGVPSLSKLIISNVETDTPTFDEQIKIGEYFSNLDHLITLHHRKYMKNIDLSLFAWEQRKLEAVLSLLKDGTHGTHQDAEEGPYLLSAKNIKNGQIIIDDSSDRKISEDEFNQIHTKFTLENGDILLTIVGSIGESAILESAGKFTFQRSVAFLRPSEEMTSRFLKTEIESVQFQKELNDRKSQSAQPGVYLGDLSKIPIYITSKEEQKKIGKYFSHLDNLITLHQQKCDELRNIKKFMLQNMFI